MDSTIFHFSKPPAKEEDLTLNKLREHLMPYPPSSPAIALFKDGKLVHFIERHNIEGRSAQMIAENLIGAFEQHCN